jgi:chromosome segregation ATPase
VLYLAEVLRKSRVIGSSKAELKLMACQRGEHSWSPVPGEEIIPAPEELSHGAGVLVLVELNAAKQIQRCTEAGRQLVSILQNFTRLQEKSKTQEEEIEQWKESLTYQSQELNRRELEMETRQEELQQMEAELAVLEQQRQEIKAAQAEADHLREEFERKSQELEGAWAQLRGEANQLDERRAELQQASVLDEKQAHALEELLNRLSEAAIPTESIQEQLSWAFDLVNQQQNTLNEHWQNLELQKSVVQGTQEGIDRQTQALHDRQQIWSQAQTTLEQARADLQAKQAALSLKQEQVMALSMQIQTQEGLHQQVASLVGESNPADLESLQNMSIEELQTTVQDLEKDLEKLSRFVSGQEEELSLQQQAIDDLKQQIQEASEYDRLRLEHDLSDEQDRYQMLNETLVGQRRNLLERQEILKLHKRVLAGRLGEPIDEEGKTTIDVTPILQQIEQLRQQSAQEMQELEGEIQQLQETLNQVQGQIEQQSNEQAAQYSELQASEVQLRSQIADAAERTGKVKAQQELLQAMQEGLTTLRQKMEAIAGLMTQFQEANHYQAQAIAEMREAVQQLTGQPQTLGV